jgi:hypothetical protein
MSKEFDNKLKSISINALEEIIAKAVSQAIGDDCECSISNISYDLLKTKFDVTLNAPIGFSKPNATKDGTLKS